MEPGLMVDLVAFLQEARTNIDSRLSDYEVSGSPRARSPFDLGSQLPGPTHCPHWRLPRPLFYIYVCVRVCVRMCVCVCVRACVCVCVMTCYRVHWVCQALREAKKAAEDTEREELQKIAEFEREWRTRGPQVRAGDKMPKRLSKVPGSLGALPPRAPAGLEGARCVRDSPGRARWTAQQLMGHTSASGCTP
jgi:hypothetical protein